MLAIVAKLFGGNMLKYALIAGALAASVFAWDRYTDGLVKQGYEQGSAKARAEYVDRDNKALAAALAKLQAADAARQAAERKAREALRQQAARHGKEMRDADLRTKELVAAAAAGSLVLRDPGPAGGGGDPAPSAGGAPAAGPGQGGGSDISGEAAAFLLELTGLADDLARRYNRLLGHYHVTAETCRGD